MTFAVSKEVICHYSLVSSQTPDVSRKPDAFFPFTLRLCPAPTGGSVCGVSRAPWMHPKPGGGGGPRSCTEEAGRR